MHQSSAQLFKQYLREKEISPQEFSKLSGMPEAEVEGIMEGELPITSLRAHHLAAAFNTGIEVWLNADRHGQPKKEQRRSRRPSLLGCD